MDILENIQLDWLASALYFWQKDVWDTQPGYIGDIQDITDMYLGVGWKFHLDEFGKNGMYLEHNVRKNHTMKWCGVGCAYAGLTMTGTHRLRREVARIIMPSTYRLQSKAKHKEAGVKSPLIIPAKKMRMGDIVVVGDQKPYGTHITMCLSTPNLLTNKWEALEFNGVGRTPTHLKGREGRMEGVVKKKRSIKDVAVVYRPQLDWFVENP